jgi:hypothetical protein
MLYQSITSLETSDLSQAAHTIDVLEADHQQFKEVRVARFGEEEPLAGSHEFHTFVKSSR